ncbi:hypothetical protein ABZ635_26015 [Nocardiopsis sp. NPDC007018]|uniref:hypothetical protein n=1 Tax=Nocardiopsis sp. NPDC007018 TaxID=3155721 RepID=UPI0033C34F66
MAIRPAACFTIHCDIDDGCSPWENFDGPEHFASPDDAIERAVEHGNWTLIDNVLRCPGCSSATAVASRT